MSSLNGTLPSGWTTATIAELCALNPKHDKHLPDDTRVSFVPMAAVSEELGAIIRAEVRTLGDVKRGYTHFGDGDVIFAKITPCMENGKAASVRGMTNGLACGTTEFFVFRSHGAIDQDYLYHFIRQESYRKAARTQMQSGVGQARVPKEFVLNTTLPLPPLAEQRRIVAKIEALQARSRRAREALAEAGPLLEKLRQSLLAAAFRGDLTADWRAAHPNVEPAGELLRRIHTERRQKWEQAELAKVAAAGRARRGDGWKMNLPAPAPIHNELVLTELPTTWKWISFDEITAASLYGPRFGANEYDASGIPTVRTTDMDFYGNICLTDAPGVLIEDRQRDHFLLKPNDLLITRTGATIGKAALYNSTLGDAIASAYLIRYRLVSDACLPKYVLYFLMSPFGRTQLVGGAQAVAQPNVNTATIAAIGLPLPPIEEQRRIATALDRSFTAIDALADESLIVRKCLDHLDQTILAKAFCGELVPQDPRDEPASVLLERIQEERSAAGGNGRSTSNRRQKGTRR